MRILHTSDWHIGRTFHGHQTLPALREVLAALVDRVRELRVDLVLVAGDVFDTAMPSGACFTLLTDTLAGLREAGARVILTSGNHDSVARLAFQAPLLREGIHVLTDPDRLHRPVLVDDPAGPVAVYGIPFLEPALLRHDWEGVRTQEDALTHAMGLIRADQAGRGGRWVVMAHCFTAGVQPTPHLERDIQQGGLDVVPLSVFTGATYTALGHIHGRAMLADRIRYSGAPLHYDFGEVGKPRGAWLVDLDADGDAEIRWVDLPVPRRLAVLTDSLAGLLTDPVYDADTDAWVSARYTDPAMQPDPMRRLQARFPHCAEVRHTPAKASAGDGRTFTERVGDTVGDDAGLVDAFLTHVRDGHAPTDQETALIRDVLAARRAQEATV